jgi:hypothetical protein
MVDQLPSCSRDLDCQNYNDSSLKIKGKAVCADVSLFQGGQYFEKIACVDESKCGSYQEFLGLDFNVDCSNNNLRNFKAVGDSFSSCE